MKLFQGNIFPEPEHKEQEYFINHAWLYRSKLFNPICAFCNIQRDCSLQLLIMKVMFAFVIDYSTSNSNIFSTVALGFNQTACSIQLLTI